MLLAQAFAKDGRKLCFNIPRRPSRTDSFYRAGPDHRAEDGFNGRGADVGKNFADIRLGQRRQAVQNGRFHAGFFVILLPCTTANRLTACSQSAARRPRQAWTGHARLQSISYFLPGVDAANF